MKQTLLQKAKLIATQRRIGARPSTEQLDLAIAWARGEVSDVQATMAQGQKHRDVSALARILRRAGRLGLIKIEKTKR